jgi:hypothetical protein
LLSFTGVGLKKRQDKKKVENSRKTTMKQKRKMQKSGIQRSEKETN